MGDLHIKIIILVAEKLRSIGRRIGTPSNDKAALQIEVYVIPAAVSAD